MYFIITIILLYIIKKLDFFEFVWKTIVLVKYN